MFSRKQMTPRQASPRIPDLVLVLASAGKLSDVAGVLLAPTAGLGELQVGAAHGDKVGPQSADGQLAHAGQ